jgi:hypothetical protein
MSVQDVTDIITAVTGLVIAIGGAIAAVMIQRNVSKGNNKTDDTMRAVGVVHRQLNSAKEASDRYAQDLRESLQTAGVKIPDDQSLRKDSDALPGEASRRELGSL